MEQGLERLLGRLGILSVVLGGHVLLALLLVDQRAAALRKQSSTQSTHTLLLLLDEEPPRKHPLPEEIPQAASTLSESRAGGEQAHDHSAETPVSAPETPVGIPQIDWHRDADVSIREIARRLIEEQQRKCEEAKRTRAPRPIGCKKDSYEANWKREPDRVGVSGLIPYVRLGKRCAVGLGFFACGIGSLPEADGTLFEDIDDPDRPRSSVPEIENGGALTELPPSIVMREQ